DGERHDVVRRHPVLALPLVEHDFERPEAEGEQAEAHVVYLKVFAETLAHQVGRIVNQRGGQQQRQDAYGDLDEEDPAPTDVVGDPAAEGGAGSSSSMSP